MAENKHTPGPWSACDGGKCRCKHVSCEDHPIAKVISGEWGDPGFPYGSVDEAVAIANARLIAAAPDLLAACELQEHADRLRTVWLCNQAVPGYDSSEDRRAWHEALGLAEEARRAAIAKARGNDVPVDA